MKANIRSRIVVVGTLAGLVAASPALAGRPAPSPLPGKIIACATDETGVLRFYKMNTDGTGRVALPVNVNGEPSRSRHGGATWFLSLREVAGELACDGSPRQDLFAVREDGNEAVTVRLTDGTTGWELEIDPHVTRTTPAGARWLPGDLDISFYAARRDPATCEYLEAGIFVAAIVFDGSGNVVGLSEMPDEPLVPIPLVLVYPPEPELPFWAPDLSTGTRCGWSPDASQVAYQDRSAWIRVHAVATGDNVGVVLATGGSGVDWSPAGDRLAYTANATWGGWCSATCDPDGTDVVVHPLDAQKSVVRYPVWNTTGSHLVHSRVLPLCKNCRNFWTGFKDMNVWRTTAGFAEGKDLTTDTDLWISPQSWVGD